MLRLALTLRRFPENLLINLVGGRGLKVLAKEIKSPQKCLTQEGGVFLLGD